MTRFIVSCAVLLASVVMPWSALAPQSHAQEGGAVSTPESTSIWDLARMHAWEVPTFDLVKRSSDERAKMLKELGFNSYAYLPMADPHGKQPDYKTSQLDIDSEIEAMKRHGIEIRAWYFWVNVDDPAEDQTVRRTLEAFKRHDIHPDIWVPQSYADPNAQTEKGFPTSPQEQTRRVEREAARIAAFVKLAAPYGCRVNLYNHRGWFGMMDNQLAILKRLKEAGITDVGMVYNFSHSRSEIHDDSKTFTDIWRRIKPHVVTVNIYISSERELEMMRIIQESGWEGSVGVLPFGGNAELNFRNALWTAEWAAAQFGSRDWQ
jgi:sugar phosphate isomerase/epimerase